MSIKQDELGHRFKLKDLNENGAIFHAIYFIDEFTGSLLVSRNNPNTKGFLAEKKEDLISSFLSAMNMFINEIKKDGIQEEIQEINFKDTRLLYQRKGRILCIGISNKKDLMVERALLNKIMNDFYYRFEMQINRFNGVIDPSIQRYSSELERLIMTTHSSVDR
ncbi:MAG: hypothetical protein ACTSYC_04805 [Promethearchaeota archaeon]